MPPRVRPLEKELPDVVREVILLVFLDVLDRLLDENTSDNVHEGEDGEGDVDAERYAHPWRDLGDQRGHHLFPADAASDALKECEKGPLERAEVVLELHLTVRDVHRPLCP